MLSARFQWGNKMVVEKFDVDVCKQLKTMARDESKTVKEYHKLKDIFAANPYAWITLDDIYQQENHHYTELMRLIDMVC